jgi:3'-phosphoadenosine 5'-phosphosulfate sulfotransferase (PAPS reductase)/FAD synthetase
LEDVIEMKHTIQELYSMQAAPLSTKVRMTASRIRAWVNEYGEDGVYLSFSGGKDSTVLAHIIREVCGYKNIPFVFADVPTQYPELKQFAMTFDNIVILKSKISFAQVCEKYGFPMISKEVAECVSGARKYLERIDSQAMNQMTGVEVTGIVSSEKLESMTRRTALLLGMLSKDNKKMKNIPSLDKSAYSQERYKFFLEAPFEISNKCCNVMKKNPVHRYYRQTGRKPIIATMASESRLRTQTWLKNGCNGFDLTIPTSTPMSFWTEQDVLLYIKENNLPICPVYGDIVIDYSAMGQCENQMSFADYGIFDNERPLLKTTGCNRTGCVLCAFGAHLEKDSRFLRLKETHPKLHNLLYVLKNNGVTYAEAIDWVNEHGNMNIRY